MFGNKGEGLLHACISSIMISAGISIVIPTMNISRLISIFAGFLLPSVGPLVIYLG